MVSKIYITRTRCTRRYLRLSFTWCERSDLLQTSNISWLLNNLYHYPVRVSWLPLSWLAHLIKHKNVRAQLQKASVCEERASSLA